MLGCWENTQKHSPTPCDLETFCMFSSFLFYSIHNYKINFYFVTCVLPRRGSILSTTIFVYAATAPVNGFMGGSLYARQGGLYDLLDISPISESLFGFWWYKWSYMNIHCFTTGRQWIKQMVLSAVLFPLLVCGTAFMINFIAIYYHASRAIPFATMVSY